MTRKEHEKRLKKIDPNLEQEINDRYKHAADTTTDGFRNFFLGDEKEKDGNDLTFYGKDDNPDLTQWGPELPLPQLPPFPDEKLQLKEQVSYLKDRNETLENKNAKLEDELSEYRQMLNILSKETLIWKLNLFQLQQIMEN